MNPLKFMFSKKDTKIRESLTVDLTLCCKYIKSRMKILSIFVAFLDNTNFKKLHFDQLFWIRRDIPGKSKEAQNEAKRHDDKLSLP